MTLFAERLGPDRLEDAIDVFCEAFHGYPVMRFVVGTDGDAAGRMRRLTTFFVRRRLVRGGPLFGVEDGGRLAGAAIVTEPDEPAPPDELAALEHDTWNELGLEARERYDRYARAAKPLFEAMPRHHHLNMIGVRPSHMGRGLARPLMDAVRRLASDDPGSGGVSLTTEIERNVRLYEHFGYQIVGRTIVTPDMEVRGLFLSLRQP